MSLIILVVVVAIAMMWGKSKPPTSPDAPMAPSDRPTSITTIEGVIKVLSGGALYIEMENPTEIMEGKPAPKKIVLVALTTASTEYIVNTSELPPFPGEEPQTLKHSLSDIKQGDKILVTSAINLAGIPEGGTFDATRIEVIR